MENLKKVAIFLVLFAAFGLRPVDAGMVSVDVNSIQQELAYED